MQAIKDQRARYHASICESLVVESSGRWWMFADCIHEAWPNAKMIGVIRDPRDWIVSWRRHQPRRHTRRFFAWFPFGALSPGAVGDEEWEDRWENLGQFGRLAWDWRMQYERLDQAAQSNPHIRLYRFEDLFAEKGNAMRDLIEFAATHNHRKYQIRDLSGFTGSVMNASVGAKKNWRDLPSDDARLLDDLCGPLMRKYGYGLEPEWSALIGKSVAENRHKRCLSSSN